MLAAGHPVQTWNGTMKWQIGDVTVTKIIELETTGGSRFILNPAVCPVA
jgi:hypothetical protein